MLKEFERLRTSLRKRKIQSLVFEDSKKPKTPDAIFPNNWIASHSPGELAIYPMMAENRQAEVRDDIIADVLSSVKFDSIIDLSAYADLDRFLEGTGSIVFHSESKTAFCCLSDRSDKKLFKEFCKRIGFKAVYFKAYHQDKPIYHTNVMMSIGSAYVVICLKAIKSKKDKNRLKAMFKKLDLRIIEISPEQMLSYCGNILELKDHKRRPILFMSKTALTGFKAKQLKELSKFASIESVKINQIEKLGGGSLRCMISVLRS